MKFVSDLRQIGGFSPGPPVSSTNKTDRQDITEILLKVTLNTISPEWLSGFFLLFFFCCCKFNVNVCTSFFINVKKLHITND
jgi:hypothetical protein